MAAPFKKIFPTASIAIFALFSFALLWLGYGLYMLKIDGLSLFTGSALYLGECMSLPGGMLYWTGTFLTQFMHFPWLGALIFAALLAIIQWLAIVSFNLPRAWWPMTAVVPALVLLLFLRIGYGIFTIKPMGYAYAVPLGVISTLLIYFCLKSLKTWWIQTIAAIVSIAIGYPLVGAFALLALVMAALAWAMPTPGSSSLRFIAVATAAASIILLPWLWLYNVGGSLMRSHIYLSGLPHFYSTETAMWVILGILALAMCLLAMFSGKLRDVKCAIWISSGVYALAIAAVCVFRCNDANLKQTLRLDHALWQQDWGRAAELALTFDSEPTRANTALGYIAMLRTNQLADKLFKAPYGWADYNYTRNASNFSDAAAMQLSYQLGLTNYAYKWATEYGIEQSMGVERLKILVKCALLNYEFDLARNYLDILYNTTFHREWAKKYKRYLKDPLLMSTDPELAAIMPLMCIQNQFINDNGSWEGYAWKLLANTVGGTEPFKQLSLSAALISKDLDGFISRVPEYAASHQRLPIYFQEAVVLWSALNGRQPFLPVDEAVAARHEQFLQAFRNSSQLEAEEQRQVMKKAFGNTFWYYFIFTDDKPII